MEKHYQIIIGSPVDYEELVAYITIDDQYIALLNQDEGKDKMKIEFFDEPIIKPLERVGKLCLGYWLDAL